ncbi:hypothetical protein C0J52_22590 [Blattella germanica]|nr:hypothetical protein C0J52_22590 [Blattella germanica]
MASEADHTYPKFMLKQKITNVPHNYAKSTPTEEVFINVSVATPKTSMLTRARKRQLQNECVKKKETNARSSKIKQNRKKGRKSQVPTVTPDPPLKKMKRTPKQDNKENNLHKEKEFAAAKNVPEINAGGKRDFTVFPSTKVTTVYFERTVGGQDKEAGIIIEEHILEKPIPATQKECFVCGKCVQTYISLNTLTNTTKSFMYQKLDKIVTGEIEILIEEEGILCMRCANLLNYMDRIEVELSMLNKAILNCIRKKFGMGSKTDKGQENLLPDIECDQNNVGRLMNLELEKSSREESNDYWTSSDNAEMMEVSSPTNEVADVEEQHTSESSPVEEQQTSKSLPIEEMQCQICNYRTCYRSVMVFHLRQHVRNLYHCDFCSVPLPEKPIICMVPVEDVSNNENDIATETHVHKAEQASSDNIEKNDTGQSSVILNSADILSSNTGYVITVLPAGKMVENKEVSESEADACYTSDTTNIDLQNSSDQTASSLPFEGHTKQIRVLNEMGKIITQEIRIDNEEKSLKTEVVSRSTTPCFSYLTNVEELQHENIDTKTSNVSKIECEINTSQSSEQKNGNYLYNEVDMLVVTETEPKELFDSSDIEGDNEMRVNVTPGMLTYSSERRLNVSLQHSSVQLNESVHRR